MRDAIESSDARVFVKGYRDLLSADEERRLFEAWWATNPQGFTDLLDPNNEEVNRFVGGDDEKYLTRIVLAYSPVIRRAIKELANYRMDEDELLSEGMIALVEAARRYAPSEHENVRFAAYAKVCVKGTMQGWIMKHFFMVQFTTNRSKKRLFYAMRKYIAIEMQKTGTFRMTPDVVTSMSEEHKVPEQDVWLMYNMFQKPFESLHQPMGHGDEEEVYVLGDTIPSSTPETEEAVLQVDGIAFHRKLIDEAMVNLTHREKTVFVARELSDKENIRTLDDLGDEFDVSKERIRQVHMEAVRKVRGAVLRIAEEKNLEPGDIFEL